MAGVIGCAHFVCYSALWRDREENRTVHFIQSWNKMVRNITRWSDPFEGSWNGKSKGPYHWGQWNGKDPSKILFEQEFTLYRALDYHCDWY